jgi:uncharacterized protein YuzE
MNMKKEVSYDARNDVFYFNESSSVQDSLDVGDFYLEFSGEGQIVGVEVLNASETISQLTGENFDSDELESILDADIKVHVKGDFAFIVLYLWIERDGEEVQESVGINVPSSTVAA